MLRRRLTMLAHGIASAFGVHTARNRLRPSRCTTPSGCWPAPAARAASCCPPPSSPPSPPCRPTSPSPAWTGPAPSPCPPRSPSRPAGAAPRPWAGPQVGGHAVALPVADARHHLHVLGATGSGKSTLLTHLILDDIANRRGVVVIDPKGDLAADVLDRLPADASRTGS